MSVSNPPSRNIVDYAEATSLYIQSTKRKDPHKKRLFDLAMKRYEAAVEKKPDDSISLTAWGDALYANFIETKQASPPRSP